jgi:hypothetical protein
MADENPTHVGGCRCGGVRYRVAGKHTYSGVCHCDDCRRATGGAFVPWFGADPDTFSVTKGKIQEYETSPGIWRGFCGACGSPLTFHGDGWDDVAITIASLDDPNSITPESNVFLRERLHWVQFSDEMRNYDGFPE